MKNENLKALNILIGFTINEHSEYKKLSNKLSVLNNKEKLTYLEENNIEFYWEEDKEKIEDLKTRFYYNITFEVDELI